MQALVTQTTSRNNFKIDQKLEYKIIQIWLASRQAGGPLNTHCEHTKISNCANELQAEGYGLWQHAIGATNLNHHVSTLWSTILLSLRSDLWSNFRSIHMILWNEHRVLSTMTSRTWNMIQ